ncbi:MAG: Transferase hexapeptide repeat containing protein [Pseudothermotoga lettingae]|nr:MAG: Transferase hexapeptide repeat containing protein [Pseudothermotoga lettingae]
MTVNKISKNAKIGLNVKLGFNVVVEDNVVIGDGTVLGNNVVIHKETVVGKNCVISDNTVLGKKPFRSSISSTTFEKQLPPLTIKNNVTIGAGCILYIGAVLSDNVFIGDLAVIREEVEIGDYTVIGKGVTIENKCKVGKYVKIETNAYITAFSEIESYCFIAPEVTFTNDNFLGRTEERRKYFKGPLIKKGARIGANATILPGIVIGEDALVAAGSVVTKNVPARKIVIGVPARIWKDVPEDQLLENQIFYKDQ